MPVLVPLALLKIPSARIFPITSRQLRPLHLHLEDMEPFSDVAFYAKAGKVKQKPRGPSCNFSKGQLSMRDSRRAGSPFHVTDL